jgi:hypothetical protein
MRGLARNRAKSTISPKTTSGSREDDMAKLSKRKLFGLVLCLGAVAAVTAGWTMGQLD